MSSYLFLAPLYDRLTGDVPYEALLAMYENLLRREGQGALTLLDLCCGTGTLTCMLAERGYEMIGVDRSPDMLAQARIKADALSRGVKPVLLCQEAAELDLYGTVNGALCSLDGMNYIPPSELGEVFRRLHLFIEPQGVLAFDMHPPAHLRALDGQTFVDEDEDMLCLWRAEFDACENALFYGMDIFRAAPHGLWRREAEEHIEYAHDPRALCEMLLGSGFASAEIASGDHNGEDRLFIRAVNGEI